MRRLHSTFPKQIVDSRSRKSQLQAFLLFAFVFLLSPFATAADSALGMVSGFVKFPGETPPRHMFANPADHDCPHGIPQNHLVVKQETRGLANALVVLDRKEKRIMPSLLKSELATVGCQLRPRMQWAALGTSLALFNKDGASHRLRAYRKDDVLFDVKLGPGGPPVRRPLVVAGLYKINCGRHPWERAWIYVSPHDSVAVSDQEGRFLIKNVPPGHYRLRVRHEGWDLDTFNKGTRLEYIPMQEDKPVLVQKDQNAEVIFDNLTGGLEFDPAN